MGLGKEIMGVSTDGMLLYGYIWDDETELFDNDDDDEWVDVVAKSRDIPNPWDRYVEPKLPYMEQRAHADAWVAEHRKELDAMYAAKRAIEDEFGVTISYHGSDGWSVPYVHIKDAEVAAYRGSPQSVTGMSLERNPEWDAKLDRFMEELGIEKPDGQDEPGWYLASWWG